MPDNTTAVAEGHRGAVHAPTRTNAGAPRAYGIQASTIRKSDTGCGETPAGRTIIGGVRIRAGIRRAKTPNTAAAGTKIHRKISTPFWAAVRSENDLIVVVFRSIADGGRRCVILRVRLIVCTSCTGTNNVTASAFRRFPCATRRAKRERW